MEVLLNAATPLQLLVGKVVGIGAASLTQMGGLLLAGITGVLLRAPLHAALLGPGADGFALNFVGTAISSYLLVLLYFLLGFFLYATLCAGLSSLVKGPDEVQNAVTLPNILLVSGYMVGYIGFSSADVVWMKVLSFFPFWTPILMLVRLSLGVVAWWEVALSVMLMLGTTYLCARLAAFLYRLGVLLYGQKPGIGQIARIIRNR